MCYDLYELVLGGEVVDNLAVPAPHLRDAHVKPSTRHHVDVLRQAGG